MGDGGSRADTAVLLTLRRSVCGGVTSVHPSRARRWALVAPANEVYVLVASDTNTLDPNGARSTVSAKKPMR